MIAIPPPVAVAVVVAIITAVIAIITAVVATVIAIITAAFSIVSPVLVVVFTVTVFLPIMGDIFMLVPVVLHEVDVPVAGMVMVTIPFPVLDMAWRDVQVDRRAVHLGTFDNHRLWIDEHRRRGITNIDLAVKARLTHADRDPDVGGIGGDGAGGKQSCK